jgi:hypothetical protein
MIWSMTASSGNWRRVGSSINSTDKSGIADGDK